MAHVADYSDDSHPSINQRVGSRHGIHPGAYASPNGVFIRPESFGNALGDYGDGRRVFTVLIRDGATAQHRDAHGAKIVWAYYAKSSVAAPLRIAFDLKLPVNI